MGTLYVVQGFREIDGSVVADKPILHGIQLMALERAETLARQRHGVLVYAQVADADRGEYSPPTILAQHGSVPHPERHTLRRAG